MQKFTLLVLILFFSLSSFVYAQCTFTLTADTISYKSCKYAIENVVWENQVNTASVQNHIIKNSGTDGAWDADAQSVNMVYNNGFMQTVVVETNTRRMIGLNLVNTNSNYPDLDYAFFLNNNGDLIIYESGSSRGTWAHYEAGDSLRISCFNNQVVYYVNNYAIYESQVSPSFPMVVDMSIASTNGTLQDVIVANATDSLYSVYEPNPGGSPSYQWKLNGVNVGSGATTYTNNLTDGDLLECVLTPGFGGCSGSGVVSNELNIKSLPIDFDVRAYASIDSVMSNSCLFFKEDVAWQTISGLEKNGTNNLIKTGANSGWDAGAFSYNKVEEGGFMETVVNETNTNRMIGLNASNTNVSYNDIDYAFYLNTGGNLLIYENGSSKGNWGSYSTGDTLRIAVVGNEVRYLQNGNIVYTSLNVPTLPLYVDLSMSSSGATVEQVSISNPAYGSFSAASYGLNNANYQWMLNGIPDGGNSPDYVNTTLVDGDSVYCVFSFDQTNDCELDTSFISNIIFIEDQDPKANLVFAIRNDSIINQSCSYAYEEVAWQSLTSLSLNGTNNVTKVGSSSGWDAGAFSYNKVEEGGFMETVVDETNTNRMIGLNASNTNVSYNDIDYAFYLNTGGNLLIYENGSSKGNWGSYSTGDTLRIAVVGNEVRYLQNGNIVYTSLNVPTLPLYVDLSISTVGGTLKDIYVNNTTYGLFSAYVNGADTVQYEWKLNGNPVGTNSSIYTNTSLVKGDEITCLLKLINTSGCSSDTTELSNKITINEVDLIQNVIFAIRNDSIIESSCLFANEDVAWQSSTSLEFQGTNNVTKVGSSSGWDAGAFSYNKVDNGGFMQTIVNETNTNRMVGLNATNTNVSYNDIDYAFYLNTGGNLLIYENGSSKGSFGSYSTGDTLRIFVQNDEVRYYNNGNLIYTSANVPNLPLFVDVSLNTVGSTIEEVTVYNGLYGAFSAFETGADSVSIQWKHNGVFVGTDSLGYFNNTLADGDSISAILSILGSTGCGDTILYSNTIYIEEISMADFSDFYITREATHRNGCQYAKEEVYWTHVIGLEENENELSKTSGSGNWNADGISGNTVGNNGFLEFVVPQTNKNLMFGLNSNNANQSYQDIDFAIYCSGSNVLVYENGSSRGTFTSFAANDTFRIDVINNVVYYLKNNTIFYTSSVTPTLPLIVDCSFSTIGGIVKDVYVGNATHGNFEAYASNVGDNPTYQWKLNGVDVGMNSSTYSNDALSEGDVVTCILIPDYSNCPGVNFESNEISIQDIPPTNLEPDFTPVSTSWLGNSSDWKDPLNWTNGVPFSGYEAVIPSGTPNDPIIPGGSYLYDLNIASGATVNLATDGYLTLYHEWVNNGSFNSSTGILELRTCNDTSIFNTSVLVSVNELVLNNEKHLNITAGNLEIQNQLEFENGNIYNGTNTLIFGDDGTWIDASENKHIEGKVQKTGDDAFTFPIGKNDTLFAPISISAPANITDHFTAEYFPVNPDSVTPTSYDRSLLDATLDHVSACEYWILDRTGGSSNVGVTLSWDTRSCEITNMADLHVARWNGGLWSDQGNGGVTGNVTQGTITSAGTVNSFSPFTLASSSNENPLPVTLISFSGTMINGSTYLKWQTASEINCKLFEVQKSENGLSWIPFAEVAGAGNSNSLNSYSLIDESPFAGLTYYRLKQIDFNGDYEFSNLIIVKNTDDNHIVAFPNPVNDVLEIRGLPNKSSVTVFDATGKIIYTGNATKLQTENWSKGVYQLKIADENGDLVKMIKLVK